MALIWYTFVARIWLKKPIPRCPFGPRHAKKSLRTRETCADSDHPTHAQVLIRAFALHSCILYLTLILLADSEGPDQTTRMRSLIWAFAVRICPKTRFCMAMPI